MNVAEAEGTRLEVPQPSNAQLIAEIAALKKQYASMHQQFQSLASRVTKLDRDVQTAHLRKR